MQWARVKRARWLGHILREDELSLVKKVVLRAYTRGERGTLMEEAPPHRSIEHMCALAAQRNARLLGGLVQNVGAHRAAKGVRRISTKRGPEISAKL